MKQFTLKLITMALTVPCLAACAGPPARDGAAATGALSAPAAIDERVVIDSDGWRLVGDWHIPPAAAPLPAVLLLHRAAGSRAEQAGLATALAARGIASLRLDLRGHGESDTLGRFEAPFPEHLHLLEETYRDINAALRWLKAHPAVDAERIAAVGASYSGEAIGAALRAPGETAAAYVILSPGSFTDESIAQVDASGAAWLFIRTREESEASLEFIDAVYAALAERSRAAEIRILPGAGHATRIYESDPGIIDEIAAWLADRLGGP